MKRKHWTFSGIRRYYPKLDFEEWLKICRKGQHHNKGALEVVYGFA